ncbi:MAG: hypothetical protein KC478_11095 [Bacteriovoracaceae bacterium]|nr:hypothetical protein [Bacteriovoracaceae bacterium]
MQANLLKHILWILALSNFSLAFGELNELPDGPLKEEYIQTKQTRLLFHWTTKTEVQERTKSFFDFLKNDKSENLSKDKVMEYLKKTATYKVKESPWNGLYFATNPIVSQRFGTHDAGNINPHSNEWVLVILSVPKATRFLNASTETPLNEQEMDWFQDRGCGLFTKAEDLDNRLVGSASGCARGLISYLSNLNAEGVVYNWWDLHVPSCSAHNNTFLSKRAVILKRDDLLKDENVFYLTSETKPTKTNLEIMKLTQDFWQQDFTSKYESYLSSFLWDIDNDGELSVQDQKHFMDCAEKE